MHSHICLLSVAPTWLDDLVEIQILLLYHLPTYLPTYNVYRWLWLVGVGGLTTRKGKFYAIIANFGHQEAEYSYQARCILHINMGDSGYLVLEYCECQNNSSWRIITKLVCPVGKYKQPWKQLHFFAIFSRFLGAYLHTHPYTKELHCIDEHRDERTNRKMDRQIRDLDDLNWIKLRVTNKSKKNNSSNY